MSLWDVSILNNSILFIGIYAAFNDSYVYFINVISGIAENVTFPTDVPPQILKLISNSNSTISCY